MLSFFSACTVEVEKKNTQVPELIEFTKTEKNKATLLQMEDILFAENYDISFHQDENIDVSYNSSTNQLKLSPVKNYSGLSFLNFTLNGEKKTLPVIVKQKIPVKVEVRPEQPTQKVYIMGSFNTWNRHSVEMKDNDGEGKYTTILELDEGVYEYQFVTDYGEFPDPENPNKVDNGYGSFNSVIKVKSDTKDAIPMLYNLKQQNDYTLAFQIQSKINAEDIKVFALEDNYFINEKYIEKKGNKVIIHTDYLKDYPRIKIFRLVATYDNQPGNIITVWTKNGKLLDENEFIWQDAVIYSLMTDRFSNGNVLNDAPVKDKNLADQANFQGGDFQGIINQINAMYFHKIGVNTLWISPVNTTTDQAFQEWPEPRRWFSGYHGYWPTEPRKTEPRFGELEKFKELVSTAHKQNVKILLDYVSNHTHKDHPYYQNHPEWYAKVDLPDGRKNIRLFDEHRLTTWFDTFLPSFDFENSQEAMNAITDDAIWWLQDTKIDGFRHDATKHVPLKVWRNITRRIKTEVQPERPLHCYQIGETFGSAELIKSYVNNGMLDSQFNFELFFTQRRSFVEEDSDFRDVKMALQKSLDVYGYNHVMGNILDSHDQTRMMSLLEGDLSLSDDPIAKAWDNNKVQVDEQSTYEKQKALMTFVICVPGVPIIYYGDEFGMTGAMDPDNRRMMRFGNELTEAEKKQLDSNAQIISLRKKHTALRRGDYLPIYCDKNVMIFSRGDQKERLIIAINKSDKKQKIKVKFPQWIKPHLEKVLVNNSKFESGGFILAPYSGNVWKCE